MRSPFSLPSPVLTLLPFAFLALTASPLAACKSGNGSGGATSSSSSGTTSSSTTTAVTSATGTGQGGTSTSSGTPTSCVPGSACPAVVADCLGLVDNTGKTSFGLRVSEADFTSPPLFATGSIAIAFAGDTQLDEPACNLQGPGSITTLLEFDTSASTLTVGSARPLTDPTTGYSIDTETLTLGSQMFKLNPAVFNNVKPDANGMFATQGTESVLLAFFTDFAGDNEFLVPLQHFGITGATLTNGQNCIGKYNAAGLNLQQDCQPDSMNPQFLPAATMSGDIRLEDADQIPVATMGETLCVLLSGDPTTYGMVGATGTVCKRDASNKIVFQGDWCDGSNAAADANCADASHVVANFAASSVLIND